MVDEDIAAVTTPLFPYSDDSGFEMRVRVERDEHELVVIVKHTNERVVFSAERWPVIRNEIDRLVAFMSEARRALSQDPKQ